MKGKLFELAQDFVKLGYVVYGWSDPKYYPYNENEYNTIVIGKENDPRVVSVWYDICHDIYVSREIYPNTIHGAGFTMFTEKDMNINPDNIIEFAFNKPLPETKTAREWQDIFAYLDYTNSHTKMFEPIIKEKTNKYCCSVCKGTNLQILAWVDPNTNKYISDYDDECWCEDCEDYTSLEEIEQ